MGMVEKNTNGPVFVNHSSTQASTQEKVKLIFDKIVKSPSISEMTPLIEFMLTDLSPYEVEQIKNGRAVIWELLTSDQKNTIEDLVWKNELAVRKDKTNHRTFIYQKERGLWSFILDRFFTQTKIRTIDELLS